MWKFFFFFFCGSSLQHKSWKYPLKITVFFSSSGRFNKHSLMIQLFYTSFKCAKCCWITLIKLLNVWQSDHNNSTTTEQTFLLGAPEQSRSLVIIWSLFHWRAPKHYYTVRMHINRNIVCMCVCVCAQHTVCVCVCVRACLGLYLCDYLGPCMAHCTCNQGSFS